MEDIGLFRVSAVILILSIALTRAKTINNALVGQPIVRCGPDRIEIEAQTDLPFDGVVYMKNWRKGEGCSNSYENAISSSHNPSHGIPISALGTCGLQMKRRPETRELEIFGVFVFSFHPMFVTMGDRAFAVHCIFRQEDKTVQSGFSLGDFPPTKETISGTGQMPKVALKIVAGGIPDVTLDPVSTVSVGDPLMFIWYLPRPSEIYGISVRDCTAKTMKGREVRIVDNGCAMDTAAMDAISYSDDMSKAFASAMAFKFADVEDMWFTCTVTTCIRENEGSSEGTSADVCAHLKPDCQARVKRNARETLFKPIVPQLDDDITEQRILVLDAYNRDTVTNKRIIPDKKHRKLITLFDNQQNETAQKAQNEQSSLEQRLYRRRKPWQICMRKPIFALVTSVILIMYTVTFVLGALAVVVYWNRLKSSMPEKRPELLISPQSNYNELKSPRNDFRRG